MKQLFLCVLMGIICSAITLPAHGQAPTSGGRFFYENVVVKNRGLNVGTSKNYGPYSCAWLQIGDTGTSKGLYMPISDTAKVIDPLPGTFIFNKDSMLYYHNGKLWKPAGT